MALTDEQLEIISEALQPLFQYLEKEVIVDVARRIKKTLTYTRTAELQAMSMYEMGYSPARIRREAMKLLNADEEFRRQVEENTLKYKKEVKELIKEITEKAKEAGNEIVANAGTMAWIEDMSVWQSAGKELTNNSFLHQLVEAFSKQTAGELKNLTKTTGFKMMSGYETLENVYKRELDKALIKICTGTFSRDTVLKDVVHGLAQSGLRSIDFASGRSMQLDTASRVALRTGCHQLAARVTDKNIEQTEVNLVYVSKHWGARNTGTGHANHAKWQGRVYYIKEGQDYSAEARRIHQDSITGLWEATGYSIDGSRTNDPLGLYGYNCRHHHYPWFVGASTLPKSTPEPKAIRYDGKTYDYYGMTQKMRSMERSVRALKREKEALSELGMDTTHIKARISKKTSEYMKFCDLCKTNPKESLLRYECGTSNLKKTKAWKRLQNTSFENDLKAKTLGASKGIGDGTEPILIGQIDVSKKEDAVEYFGEQIRDSETEKVYVIDVVGNVYYNEGKADGVSVGTLDLSNCIVLHNHPKVNGIVSFGQDDFMLMRDFQSASFRLVNEEYNYVAEVVKPIDGLTYNQLWMGALELTDGVQEEDYQHLVMEYLTREGYIRYVRKKVDRDTD